MRRLVLIVLTLATSGVGAASSAAQAPSVPGGPVVGQMTVSLGGVRSDGRDRFVLKGDRVQVRGTLTPYVPGQRVMVRIYRGTRKLSAQRVLVRRSGDRGTFVVRPRMRVRGHLTVRAVHRATPEMGTVRAKPRALLVASPVVAADSSGVVVRRVQSALARLGYVVPRTSRYDPGTARALMAWRKVTGRRRAFTAGPAEVRSILAGSGRWRVRHPGAGRHVEADLSQQVMVLVDGGRVDRIYHVSSGAPSTPTIVGAFSVYRKDLGTNQLGMVHAAYFRGGYAIHGYKSVPAFPASHGCLRVPVPDALSIYNWLRHGDRVFVSR